MGLPASHRIPRVLWYSGSFPCFRLFRLQGCHLLWLAFPLVFGYCLKSLWNVLNPKYFYLVWALPLSLAATYGIIIYFHFLRVLRCFSSPRSPHILILLGIWFIRFSVCEFPHSDICGSMNAYFSPQRFAVCRVLLRLPVPRHSPHALYILTYSYSTSFILTSRLKSFPSRNFTSHFFMAFLTLSLTIC